MGQTDWDTQPKYSIWPARLATDLSLCNVSQARLNSLQQELLGVSLRIKADCVRRQLVGYVDLKRVFCLYARNFTESESWSTVRHLSSKIKTALALW